MTPRRSSRLATASSSWSSCRRGEAPEGTRFLLGVDDADVAYFGVSGGRGRGSRATVRSPPTSKPMSLRQAGALLSDRDAGLLTHAVALANWHDTHTHCPQCGTPTVPAPAGHLTTCPADGTEHFPRLDPAVIMLVLDPDDRLLLARNALWPAGRMSVVAGFVEPGESAEHAVTARFTRRPRSRSARSATWAASRGRCRAA